MSWRKPSLRSSCCQGKAPGCLGAHERCVLLLSERDVAHRDTALTLLLCSAGVVHPYLTAGGSSSVYGFKLWGAWEPAGLALATMRRLGQRNWRKGILHRVAMLAGVPTLVVHDYSIQGMRRGPPPPPVYYDDDGVVAAPRPAAAATTVTPPRAQPRATAAGPVRMACAADLAALQDKVKKQGKDIDKLRRNATFQSCFNRAICAATDLDYDKTVEMERNVRRRG